MEPKIKIEVISLFPGMVEGFLGESILNRAITSGILEVALHNLRDWTEGPHFQADDRPFGGGAGMVLMPEPLFKAVESLKKENTKVVYLCPDGEPLTSNLAKELSKEEHLILVSGHYEGVDERFREKLVDKEVSIGDYILTNGTLAAAVVVDSVARYVSGVLGEEKSLTQDSFNDNLLTFPQYTRPSEFRGMKVPEVLLSGNHAAIAEWRKAKQIERTEARRPDLLKR